jgi:hypothetical protein
MVHSMFGSFRFADDFLDLADLFLNFTGLAFRFAFGFQVRIHADFSGDLLDLTLDLMPLAFCFVPRA